MKNKLELEEYKRCYYLFNKKKLIEYSKNYYTYKKCKGDFTDKDISDNMKIFLSKYKNHNKKKDKNIKISNEPIIISFN